MKDIGVQVEPNALTALSGWAALDRCVLPFAHRDGHIEVLVPDTADLDLISWLQFATGCCVIAHQGDRELVCKAIRHYYQLEECDVAECIDPICRSADTRSSVRSSSSPNKTAKPSAGSGEL